MNLDVAAGEVSGCGVTVAQVNREEVVHPLAASVGISTHVVCLGGSQVGSRCGLRFALARAPGVVDRNDLVGAQRTIENLYFIDLAVPEKPGGISAEEIIVRTG